MKYIFLIPARSGSKRLEDKNLRKVGNSPLLERAIKFAQSSSIKDSEIYLSSDSQEYLSFAVKLGAKTHLRTKKSSDDNALARDVVNEFLSTFSKLSLQNSVIVYLQPTSPLRLKRDLHKLIEIFNERKMPVFSAREVNHHPQKMLQMNETRIARKYLELGMPTQNTQDLESLWMANGSYYIFTPEQFLNHQDIPVLGALGIEIEAPDIDIDTESDIEYANYLIERGHFEDF
jgi:CMP-N-acetylneuraminic acid synthetase